jgi:hypothetical protein
MSISSSRQPFLLYMMIQILEDWAALRGIFKEKSLRERGDGKSMVVNIDFFPPPAPTPEPCDDVVIWKTQSHIIRQDGAPDEHSSFSE